MEKDMAMMGDKLILRGLKFYGFHGAIPEEKTLGQMFMLDIDAWICLKKAGLSDNLSDSISYVDIYKLVSYKYSFLRLVRLVKQKRKFTKSWSFKYTSSLRNTRSASRDMNQFVGFMKFQLKHKWKSKHLHTISAWEFYSSSAFPTVTSANSCSGYKRMHEQLQVLIVNDVKSQVKHKWRLVWRIWRLHNQWIMNQSYVNSRKDSTLELQVVATRDVLLFTEMKTLFITVMLLKLAAKYCGPFQVDERIGVGVFKVQPLSMEIAAVWDNFASVFVIVILVVVDRLSTAANVLGLKHPFKPGLKFGVHQQMQSSVPPALLRVELLVLHQRTPGCFRKTLFVSILLLSLRTSLFFRGEVLI